MEEKFEKKNKQKIVEEEREKEMLVMSIFLRIWAAFVSPKLCHCLLLSCRCLIQTQFEYINFSLFFFNIAVLAFSTTLFVAIVFLYNFYLAHYFLYLCNLVFSFFCLPVITNWRIVHQRLIFSITFTDVMCPLRELKEKKNCIS